MVSISSFVGSVLSFVFISSRIDSAVSVTEISKEYNTVLVDYKVETDAGKEDCFYQYVMPQSSLYINLVVMKGGERKVGLGIREPNGTFVLPYEWKQEVKYSSNNTTSGFYALCISNEVERFTSKVVSVFLHNYVAEDMERYHAEFDRLEISVANFSKPLVQVNSDISLVLQHLHHARNREAEDYELLQNNNFYISFWSIVQCTIIICTGGFHVYFIRKLFDTPNKSRKVNHYFKR